MLAKLKIAVVLLVIGMFSGVSIWGVNTWTAPIIEENQARAQAEMYRQIFADLDYVEIEDYDHDIINQKVRVFDANGNEIGVVLRGRVTNNFGYVQALVGISNDGKLAKVLISDHTNTPNYANIIISNYLDNFTGQDVTNVQYDANTGATATYNAVRRIVEAAIMETAGDVRLDVYQEVFTNAASYDDTQSTTEGFDLVVSVYDEDGNLLGRVYEGSGIRVFINADDELVKILAIDPNDSDLVSALAAFEDYYNQAIGDIEFDVDGEKENEIASLVEGLFIALGGQIDINDDVLNFYEYIYEDGNHVGYKITGQAEGFNGTMIVAVSLNLEGEITAVEIVSHEDTTDYVNDYVLPNLDDLIGLTSVDTLEANDTFTGATNSGRAVLTVVKAALAFDPEAPPVDDDDDDDDEVIEFNDIEFETLKGIAKAYDENDMHIGHYLLGEIQGHNGMMEVLVLLGIEGEVTLIDVLENEESGWALTAVMNAIDEFTGITDVSEVDMDAFAGVTMTAQAIKDVVEDALAYYANNLAFVAMDEGSVYGKAPAYNDAYEPIGVVYYGSKLGHNGVLHIAVTIGLDQSVLAIDIRENDESGWALNAVLAEIDAFIGIRDGATVDMDTFSGVTVTAQTIKDIVTDVLTYHTATYNVSVIDDATTLTVKSDAIDATFNVVGTQYIGEVAGHNGLMTVLVVIDTTNTVTEVIVLEDEESGWAMNTVYNNFDEFLNIQNTDEIDMDAFAGVTVSAESIRTVIMDALNHEGSGE